MNDEVFLIKAYVSGDRSSTKTFYVDTRRTLVESKYFSLLNDLVANGGVSWPEKPDIEQTYPYTNYFGSILVHTLIDFSYCTVALYVEVWTIGKDNELDWGFILNRVEQ